MKRLHDQAKHQARLRAAETPLQRSICLQDSAERQARKQNAETSTSPKRCTLSLKRKKNEEFENASFRYNPKESKLYWRYDISMFILSGSEVRR